MAATWYRVNTTTVLTPGTFNQNLYAASGTVVNGTGSYASAFGNYGSGDGTGANPGGLTFNRGQLIELDSGAALVTALGANLTALAGRPAQETGGGYGTAN